MAYFRSNGVEPNDFRELRDGSLGILREQMEKVFSAVEDGDHSTDQASVATYAAAAAQFVKGARESGNQSYLLGAAA